MSGEAADRRNAAAAAKKELTLEKELTAKKELILEKELALKKELTLEKELTAEKEPTAEKELTAEKEPAAEQHPEESGQISESARMEVLIEAMTPPGPARLQELEQEAVAAGVPVIRPQTQNLLRFFLSMNRPARILEVGTAVGFSALFMQHYAPAGCRITTIEKDHERALQARENFIKYDSGDSIVLLEGDAAQVLHEIREDASFDLIFMDAAKGQYIRFLPDALRLLRCGGIMITDNILQEGEILSSRFAVTRRNRTIHARMRAYIRALMEEPQLETLLLPTGDGAAVSCKTTRSS